MTILEQLQQALLLAQQHDETAAIFVKNHGSSFLSDPDHYTRSSGPGIPGYWGSLPHTLTKLMSALSTDMYVVNKTNLNQGAALAMESLTDLFK